MGLLGWKSMYRLVSTKFYCYSKVFHVPDGRPPNGWRRTTTEEVPLQLHYGFVSFGTKRSYRWYINGQPTGWRLWVYSVNDLYAQVRSIFAPWMVMVIIKPTSYEDHPPLQPNLFEPHILPDVPQNLVEAPLVELMSQFAHPNNVLQFHQQGLNGEPELEHIQLQQQPGQVQGVPSVEELDEALAFLGENVGLLHDLPEHVQPQQPGQGQEVPLLNDEEGQGWNVDELFVDAEVDELHPDVEDELHPDV